MTFLWPQLLWLLALGPVAVAAYVYVLRRKKLASARYASLAMLREAAGHNALRRHAAPILFLLALMIMILAIARPAAVVTLPSQRETVILAIDVSGSMRATDVEPNRLAAAQAAARTFINEQPHTTRIGIVAFAAAALVVQQPTQNHEDLLAALDRLQLQRGTALGSGIVVALRTLFPDAGITLESLNAPGESRPARGVPLPDSAGSRPDKAQNPPTAPGSFTSAAIILLTDGQRTTGPDPLQASRLAAERGVRIFTVGVGTPDGEVMGFEGWRMRVRLDEETLKTIAGITHGQYFYAANATELKNIYRSLNSRFVLEKQEREITGLFSGVAALLAACSALLSLAWFNRIF